MSLCKWCGQSSDFGKSHIIPKYFYKLMDGDHTRHQLAAGEYDRMFHGGYNDKSIICKKCERDFSYIDDEGIEVLQKLESYPVLDAKKGVLRLIPEADSSKLIRMVLYTLWKASVSSSRLGSAVNLGPYEDIIKNKLIENKPFHHSEWSMWCMHFKSNLAFVNPFKTRMSDSPVNLYRVPMCEFYEFIIKVDKRPLDKKHNPLIALKGIPILTLDKPLKDNMPMILDIYNQGLKRQS